MAYYHFKSAGFSATKTLHKSFSSGRNLIVPFPRLEYRAQNLSIRSSVTNCGSNTPFVVAQKNKQRLSPFSNTRSSNFSSKLCRTRIPAVTHICSITGLGSNWLMLIRQSKFSAVELAKDAVKVSGHSITISHKDFSRRLQASKHVFEGFFLILNVLYPVKNKI